MYAGSCWPSSSRVTIQSPPDDAMPARVAACWPKLRLSQSRPHEVVRLLQLAGSRGPSRPGRSRGRAAPRPPGTECPRARRWAGPVAPARPAASAGGVRPGRSGSPPRRGARHRVARDRLARARLYSPASREGGFAHGHCTSTRVGGGAVVPERGLHRGDDPLRPRPDVHRLRAGRGRPRLLGPHLGDPPAVHQRPAGPTARPRSPAAVPSATGTGSPSRLAASW